MRISLIALLLVSSCFIAACGACSGDPKPAVEAEPPHEPPSKAAKTAIADPTPDEVPIPEDFEEEAAREVSEENLAAQLDALEQEIAADSQ